MRSRLTTLTVAVTVLLAAFTPCSAQQKSSPFSLELYPGVEIPVGQSADFFSLGGAAVLSAAYALPISFPLSASVELGYQLLPVDLPASAPVHLLAVGAGIGVDLEFLQRFRASAWLRAGYFLGLVTDEVGETVAGGNPYLRGGGSLAFGLLPSLSLGIGAAYTLYLGSPQPFAGTVGVNLGARYRLPLAGSFQETVPPGERPALLKLTSVSADGILPVFYQYYDTHPIGTAVLANGESSPVSDITVSVFIRQYMDSPKVFTVPGSIEAGAKLTIDLFALFTEKVLSITEGARVAAEFAVRYTARGIQKTYETVETVRLENRNASIWDDNRRPAAFVTARDPAVLSFSKAVAALAQGSANQSVDYSLRVAVAMHHALTLAGMGYVPDPRTPYVEFAKNRNAIDFLQFPRQTLEYRSGDCDDLSILYAALLQAANVETAFVLVPNHIYLAFALGIARTEVERMFTTGDLIIEDGTVWVPLEVTLVQKGFLEAWSEGARQWKEYQPVGKADLVPLAKAWEVFEPVGLPGEAALTIPPSDRIGRAFESELSRLIDREIAPRVKDIESRIAQAKDSPKLINSLGTLYARFGLLDKAEAQYQKIAGSTGAYTPALINLGNIRLMRSDTKGALAFYTRAAKQDPDNPVILLGLAQAYRGVNDLKNLEATWQRLARVSPATVQQYPALAQAVESGTRAGSAVVREAIQWQE
jgi:tetratricopeptide (TPR) repeat protein